VPQCNENGESIKKVGIHELAPKVSCPNFLSTLHAPSKKNFPRSEDLYAQKSVGW
jgi:hypothetical protein